MYVCMYVLYVLCVLHLLHRLHVLHVLWAHLMHVLKILLLLQLVRKRKRGGRKGIADSGCLWDLSWRGQRGLTVRLLMVSNSCRGRGSVVLRAAAPPNARPARTTRCARRGRGRSLSPLM